MARRLKAEYECGNEFSMTIDRRPGVRRTQTVIGPEEQHTIDKMVKILDWRHDNECDCLPTE